MFFVSVCHSHTLSLTASPSPSRQVEISTKASAQCSVGGVGEGRGGEGLEAKASGSPLEDGNQTHVGASSCTVSATLGWLRASRRLWMTPTTTALCKQEPRFSVHLPGCTHLSSH